VPTFGPEVGTFLKINAEGEDRGVSDPVRAPQWSGSRYAQQSAHHRALDEWFLARHPPAPTDVVVDLGCGSGEFSARLAALVPNGLVIGVDADPSMLATAHRLEGPNLSFRQATAERVDEAVAPSSVDIVVSRAMLHWLPISLYLRCFQAVFRILRPGGWFHSESAGAGNVASMTRLLDEVASVNELPATPPFPDAGTVFDLIGAAGFEIPEDGVRTVAQRRPFTRETLVGLLRTQAGLAVTRHAPADAAEGLLNEVTAKVDQLRRNDGSYAQTFVRLEIMARRPA
jgi:SAM-dependent methyltransferase